jgi:hypothetical protein
MRDTLTLHARDPVPFKTATAALDLTSALFLALRPLLGTDTAVGFVTRG